MRISDWSSDVCSSDLHKLSRHHRWTERGFRRVEFRDDGGDRGGAARGPDHDAVLPAASGIDRSAAGRRITRRAHGRAAAEAQQSSVRSEEHTSELQSLMRISYAVFCLKKKNKN